MPSGFEPRSFRFASLPDSNPSLRFFPTFLRGNDVTEQKVGMGPPWTRFARPRGPIARGTRSWDRPDSYHGRSASLHSLIRIRPCGFSPSFCEGARRPSKKWVWDRRGLASLVHEAPFARGTRSWDRPDSNQVETSLRSVSPGSNRSLSISGSSRTLVAQKWDRPDSNRGHGHPRPEVYQANPRSHTSISSARPLKDFVRSETVSPRRWRSRRRTRCRRWSRWGRRRRRDSPGPRRTAPSRSSCPSHRRRGAGRSGGRRRRVGSSPPR